MSADLKVDPILLEEDAEDLYQHAPCGYMSTLPDGTILKVNQTLLDWLGYTENEFVFTKRFSEILSIGGRIYFETHFAPLLRMQGHLNEVSLELVSKTKSKIPILASAIQRVDETGQVVVNRITLFNITDRKKFEKELIIERKKAQAAAQAKADFLSMMSHEIRTPMNAVVGIAHLIESTDLSEQQREYVGMLKASSENLMGLLNSILDFNRIESGKTVIENREFGLGALALETMQGLESRAKEKNVSLKAELDSNLPTYVVGDPIKLRQVLTNLIGNAIKFTDNGSVTLKISLLEASVGHISLNISVIDTGIGIAQERLPYIFDEFMQADNEIGVKYGGSGLGLAISQKLVALFGSKIQVQSDKGKGSNFSFDLTLKMSDGASLQATEGIKPNAKSLAGVKVLIAEDSEDNVFILGRFLTRWNIDYEVALNGKEAVDKIKAYNFDLFLSDIRMPIMDGIEAAKQVRALEDPKKSQLPIIAFSASIMAHDRDFDELSMFDEAVGKPFRPDDLFKKMLQLVGDRGDKGDNQSESTVSGKLGESADNAFCLDSYYKALEDDNEAIKEMLVLVIKSYQQASKEFRMAFDTRDIKRFEFHAHKIKNSIEMLKANSLKAALQHGHHSLSSESSTLEAHKNIQFELERLISGLKLSIR